MNEKRCTDIVHPVIKNCTVFDSVTKTKEAEML